MKKDISNISRNNLRLLKITPLFINAMFMYTVVQGLFIPVTIPASSLILVVAPFLCLWAISKNLGFCLLYRLLLITPFVYLCAGQAVQDEMTGTILSALFICLSFMFTIANIGKLHYDWFKG